MFACRIKLANGTENPKKMESDNHNKFNYVFNKMGSEWALIPC